MIYQDDPDFTSTEDHFGCCLFSTAYLALKATGALDQFITDNMKSWLATDEANQVIGADDYLENPQAWLDTVAGPGKLVYLDTVLPADYVPQQCEFVVDYIYNPDTKFHHFVVGWQPGGDCEYDPLNSDNGHGSYTAHGPKTYIESRRGFKLA
ncbi:MAG: hypothetical protein HKM05_08850 [Spirochaetales bacterium]|nr:hypothetical protein [Spirochaetales bacterium]